MRIHSTKTRKLAFVVMAIASLVTVITVINDKMSSNITVDMGPNSNVKTGGNLEIKIGPKGGERLVSLNADELANINIDDSQLIKLKKDIKKNVDYKQIVSDIERFVEDGTEGFLLSDTKELSISKYNLSMINLNNASVSNIAYEFLFSNSKPVGYVMFFIADGKLEYNISLNTADTYGYYFDFLESHKNMSFVVLTDGFSNYFLSENNTLYSPSSLEIVKEISVEGDCYQAIEVNKISVSYEKIVNQIEIIE